MACMLAQPVFAADIAQATNEAEQTDWAGARVYNADFETSPAPGPQTTWRTVVHILPTASDLLVKVEALDPDTSQLQAADSRTDALRAGDDAVRLWVDAEGQGQRAFVFAVNAAGARSDYIFSSSGRSSPQWNGRWTSHARLTEQGYQVVYKIPFDTLGISGSGKKRIRIDVSRKVGRDRFQTLGIAQIDPLSDCRECQFIGVEVSATASAKPKWRVLPYAAVAAEQTVGGGRTRNAEAGADLFWESGKGEKLAATLNPDFSEIALDRIQFSVNQRFALAYAERRPFFTSDAGMYSSKLPLLYTRNIIDPSFGVQASTRHRTYEAAAFLANDSFLSYIDPQLESSSRITAQTSTTNLVGRASWMPSSSFSIGVFGSERAAEGYKNSVLAVDGAFKRGAWTWEGQIARSDRKSVMREGLSGVAGKLIATYGNSPLQSSTSLTYIDESFRADLGIVNQVGVIEVQNFEYLEWNRPGKLVDSVSATYDFTFQGNVRGATLFRSHGLGGLAHFRTNTSLILSYSTQADVENTDTFRSHTLTVAAKQDFGKKISASVNASTGRAVDYSVPQLGKLSSWSASVSYRGGRKLTGTAVVSRSELDSPGGLSYSAVTGDLRLTADLSKRHHILVNVVFGSSSATQSAVSDASSSSAWQLGYQFDVDAFRRVSVGFSERLAGNSESWNSLEPQRRFAFLKVIYGFGP